MRRVSTVLLVMVAFVGSFATPAMAAARPAAVPAADGIGGGILCLVTMLNCGEPDPEE
ncbi:hypothetical protein [Streptomyces luteireticuli]|uniref:Chaplin n=1 Tax=Streptomyces luteireticuli TaxID=173858 RepID=A0ABP3I8C7_9ACTN